MNLVPDLSRRCVLPELMDDPGLDPELHAAALKGLSRLNWLGRTSRILWSALRPLAIPATNSPLRILDVGCGDGEVALGLAARAREDGARVEIAGCDMSGRALESARRRAQQHGIELQTFERDVCRTGLPAGFDVIYANMFLHHLRHEDAVTFLSRAAQAARRMVLINDLRRSAAAYCGVWLITRLLTRSEVVHEDSLLSIRAAFTAEELRSVAEEAALAREQISVKEYSLFQMQMAWHRPEEGGSERTP